MSGILDQLQKTNNNTTQKRTFVGVETKEEIIAKKEGDNKVSSDNIPTTSIVSDSVKSILERIRNRMKKSAGSDGEGSGVSRFDDVPFFANKGENEDNEKIGFDDFIPNRLKDKIEKDRFIVNNGIDDIPPIIDNSEKRVIDDDGIIKIKKKKIKKKKVDSGIVDENGVEVGNKIDISSLSTGEIIKLVKDGKINHKEVLKYIKNNKLHKNELIGLNNKTNLQNILVDDSVIDDNKINLDSLQPSEVLKLVKEGKLKHSDVLKYIKNNKLNNGESSNLNNKTDLQGTSSVKNTVDNENNKININNLEPSEVLKLVREGKITHSEAMGYIKNRKLNITEENTKVVQPNISNAIITDKKANLQDNTQSAGTSNTSIAETLKMVRERRLKPSEVMDYIRNNKIGTVDNIGDKEVIRGGNTINETESKIETQEYKEEKIVKNDFIDEDIKEIVKKRLWQAPVTNIDDPTYNKDEDSMLSTEDKIINKGYLQDYSVAKTGIQKSIITDDDFLIRPKIKNEDIVGRKINNSFIMDNDLLSSKQQSKADLVEDNNTVEDVQNIKDIVKEEEQNIVEEDIVPFEEPIVPFKEENKPSLTEEVSQDNNSAVSKNKESNDFLQNLMNVEEKELPQNVDNIEEKKEEVEYIYSSVIDFTSSVPIESFDGDGYEKIRADKCVFLDSHITENDLIELYKNKKDIESLDISNCDNLVNFNIISKFENLKELNVNNCDNFDNIECLQGCKNLRVLNIGNTKVRNIDNIGIFPELRIFNCSCNSITNIKNIYKCEKLVELNLWGCVSVGDLNGLENLYNLRSLDVDSTSITDLFPLVNCKNIEFLFMDNCTKLTDLYSLSSLSNLKCLLADGKNMLTDSQLEVFEDLTTLEYLTLNSRRIHNLHYVRKLTKMKELILQGCNVTDLSPIENLTELIKLDVTANSALKDLSPLFKMTKLKKLIAGGGGVAAGKVGNLKGAASSTMAIEDISVVKNFTKLKEINLNSNIRLKDISAMSVCEKMEEVYLQKCTQLEDVSVLGNLKNIEKLNISSCPRIKELYFLRNLPNLLELLYDGTIVHTPGLTTILKKANNMYLLKGNDADILSQAMLGSGKKKAKLMKAFKSYFPSKEKEDKK